MIKTKQEKRENITNKLKRRKKMGATLSSQIKHSQTNRQNTGHKK